MSLANLLFKAIGYNMWKRFGFPGLMPIILTLSITDKCDSRCKTCNIWKIKSENELTLIEYKKMFESLNSLFWVTITGGEPFLRNDLKNIVVSLYEQTNPRYLTIPTNAILTEKIVKDIEFIIKRCPNLELILNLSLDGIGNLHDKIRGVKGNFKKVLKTYDALKKIKFEKLTVGINTVISRYNINQIKELYEFVSEKLKPDSYICEVAENRAKLYNLDLNVTPNYRDVLNFLIREHREGKGEIPELIKNLRNDFYRYLISDNMLDCYAGYASVNIMPDGDVWLCYVKKSKIGNLREANFDFKKIWFSEKADKERNKIKNCKYKCKLVNAFYTSAMCNFSMLTGLMKRK
jgi:radical SAM protein with 4Fe4S-binding SPASM domain